MGLSSEGGEVYMQSRMRMSRRSLRMSQTESGLSLNSNFIHGNSPRFQAFFPEHEYVKGKDLKVLVLTAC